MKKILIIIFTFYLLLIACDLSENSLVVSSLQTEYSQNPIGIDTRSPRFSWILKDSLRDVYQTAYCILVATNPSRLKPGKADVWNSGWVNSDQSVFVEFAGQKLESGKKYYWTVSVKDNKGREAQPSEYGYFETGFLDMSDWQAEWIGFQPKEVAKNAVPSDIERPRSVLLRKEFELPKAIKDARLYVSGLGNYVFFINGEKVGNYLLTPGWTDYNKRVQYQVYDITERVKKGENAMGIMLGNMWWSGGLGWSGAQFYSKGPLRAIAQIEIEYNNGEKEIIVTNKSWKGNLSPITDNSLYHGETWDARLEIPLWAEPGLEDSRWFPVEIIPMDKIMLSAQKAPPIKVMDTIVPVSVTKVKPGVFVYDMGLNMVGFTQLKVRGNNGDTVKLKFAELLHDDGTVAQENLRSARATDTYILKGTGVETWQPHFTYHGFRYVQMEGFPGKPGIDNLTGLRFYSSAPVIGNFECSSEMINKIAVNILNGQKGNMHSVPTDCPQRDERLGWMGDAQIYAPTASYFMDMAQFFAKWMRDITDSQHKSGYTYDVNPAIVVGGPSKAGWGDAVTVVPHLMFKFYGDKAILENNYEGMKNWVEYMKRKSVDYIYRWSEKEGDWEGYGDWISVVPTPVEPISAAYYYHSTHILAKTAALLGYSDDASYYSRLSDSIKSAFHDKFFIKEELNYPGGTQTANLLPLVFGLTPVEYRDAIVKNVIEDVREKGKHPSTGFLGTAYLLPVLSENGAHQLAFETATNENYPSWAYTVKKGATTIWELWNSDTAPPDKMNSRNHFALGSVGEWYFGYLAGIRPLKPGFKKILIAPLPAEGLSWVKANYQTPYGEIESSWRKNKDSLQLNIKIPANTSSKIVVPLKGDSNFILSESGKVIYENRVENNTDIISISSVSENEIILDVKSGTYEFMLY